MMSPRPMHREDIKAEVRKKCGSLLAFERAYKLGSRSATDALMGRRRPATAKAIADLLGHEVSVLFPGIYESAVADNSDDASKAHGLNEGGK